MNIAYEFSKVREAFEKVKADTSFLAKKISENYETFMREHYQLASRVDALSAQIKSHTQYVKDNHLKTSKAPSEKELLDLKYIVKELREEVKDTQKEHGKVAQVVQSLKKEKSDVSELAKKVESSELEIYLLKQRLAEKDEEIKQIKDVSSHLFTLVDELTQLEFDLIKKAKT